MGNLRPPRNTPSTFRQRSFFLYAIAFVLDRPPYVIKVRKMNPLKNIARLNLNLSRYIPYFGRRDLVTYG